MRHQAAGQAPPPDLAARVYRSMRQTGDDEAAAQARDLLHREAAASDTLALLSDDPFWRDDGDA